MPANRAREVLARFGVEGDRIRLERIPQGYINETYRVLEGETPVYLLQRVNTDVFGSPEQVMENILALLPHLRGPGYAGLELVKTPEGGSWVRGEQGDFWRLFTYLPGSMAHAHTSNPETAREAGRILGRFHQLVADIPATALHTPLPRFHDLAWRMAQLEQAAEEGLSDRIAATGPLLTLGRDLASFCGQIPFGRFPWRVCHNDAKLSNILFDSESGKALCLIDLDTLMPGHRVWDFGDAARTVVSPTAEEGPQTTAPHIDLALYRAYLSGWKESGFAWEAEEGRWLSHGVVLMPTLHGIRALADYLLGDRYYTPAYPGQNLERARNLLGFAQAGLAALPGLQQTFREVFG
jgi:Ser/Thr protein kinase RdoA (MazF antagonist)